MEQLPNLTKKTIKSEFCYINLLRTIISIRILMRYTPQYSFCRMKVFFFILSTLSSPNFNFASTSTTQPSTPYLTPSPPSQRTDIIAPKPTLNSLSSSTSVSVLWYASAATSPVKSWSTSSTTAAAVLGTLCTLIPLQMSTNHGCTPIRRYWLITDNGMSNEYQNFRAASPWRYTSQQDGVLSANKRVPKRIGSFPRYSNIFFSNYDI